MNGSLPTRRQVLAAMLTGGVGTALPRPEKMLGEGPSLGKKGGYLQSNDGVRLYFEEAGSGPPVFLIHGGAMSLVWWRRNLPVLAEQFHVIAADTRGCGRSDKPAWGHRTARYAKDVYDLIEQLGLRDVTLVGWSIGARTCYSYLELFGRDRLRSVVLVDETVAYEVHAPAPPGSEQQPGESTEAYERRSLRAMVSPRDPAQVTDEDLEWMMAATTRPTPATLRDDYRAQDWRPFCPVIKVPVLITAGRHSGALPGCLYAAEHIPGAKLVMFEHSGHCPFYTEASRFNQSVADFVHSIRRG